MLSVTEEFHKAFKESEREVFAKVTINGTTYLKDKIKTINYSAGVFGGENYQIGSTQSATVKIIFTEIIEGLKELDEVKIELGIKIRGSGLPSDINNVSRIGRAKIGKARIVSYIPDRYEFVPLGTFYISDRVDPNRNENTTTIEARDGFIFMESDYQSKLSYPIELPYVALEIANLSGSEIDPVSFNHLNEYVINEPVGYTYRQAIGLIGQFQTGFVFFDRYGRLAIRNLEDPRFRIDPNEYFLKGLTKSELMYQPKGISCKVVTPKGESSNETNVLQAGSTAGAQISIENNVMTQPLLNLIFQQVKGINYYPINLKWRGNPALEVGDWVTMIDRKGKQFKSPVLNYTIVFDGGLNSTISADTKAYSSNVSTFKGPLQQKLDELDHRVDAAGKNNVYDGTEEPKHPKEGDIWFKKNGPDDEIWVYKQISPGVFEWVMTTSTTMDQDIKDQIENSTPKDDIIKTINLSSEMDGKEWLKIEGAKIWLTKETKIDRAIITSAMIGSVDAGTINAGTLDASKITVTNLNAKAISTGIATGKNLSINFDTGQVNFQSGNITNALGKININLDKSLMYFKKNTTNSSVIGDNGFVVYNGTPTSSNIDIYDNKIIVAVGKFSGTPGLIGNRGLEVASYKYKKLSNGSVEYQRVAGFEVLSNGDAYLFSEENKTLQIGYANTKTLLMSYTNDIRGNLTVGNLNATGAKNAIHVTRDGVRATPAYETTESYLGDIGRNVTNEECEVWVPIDAIFSDTVNLDIPYEVFLQVYDDARVWVSDFRSDAFLVCSDRPMIRFAWEIKAKRTGYEKDRLVLQEFTNQEIEERWREDL
jgi:hypothetical protein